MKKYFITGLVILLPVALTVTILNFVFNFLTVPFLGIVRAVFERYHLFEQGFLFLNETQFQNLIAQSLILISLFFFAAALGFIARWFFFHTLIIFAEYIVKKIPFVRTIYRTCQDVIKTIFTSKTNAFKQVVLVKFPNPNTYSLGFLTGDTMPGFQEESHHDAITVFIPTTPNPTSGFLMMYKREEVLFMDMKVEEAFKFIISCGVITPSFQVKAKEEPGTGIVNEGSGAV
jgi:uncharacterized membrane protein